MRRDVFISYQHNDSRFAFALCNELERQGISCWIAPRNIRPGDSWRASIVSAVEMTQVMVLVFSSNTQSSNQVLKELSIADDSSRTVLPLMLENLAPQGEYKFQLTGRHWIQAYGGGETVIRQAAHQIRWYLESLRDGRTKLPGPRHHPPHPPMAGRTGPESGSSFTRSVMLVAGFLALLALATIGFKAAFFQEDKAPATPANASFSAPPSPRPTLQEGTMPTDSAPNSRPVAPDQPPSKDRSSQADLARTQNRQTPAPQLPAKEAAAPAPKVTETPPAPSTGKSKTIKSLFQAN